MIKIGINGFGRIGRITLRAAMKYFPNIQIVGVNDIIDYEHLVYMLKYDSVHGKFEKDIILEKNKLIIDGNIIHLSRETNPKNIKWNDINADIIIESTGMYLDYESASTHLKSGAKNVIISAPSKNDVPMFVYGINNSKYTGQPVISNASCTTNCLAPIIYTLNNAFGIKRGIMTTLHATTSTQKTVDSPSKKDWRSGRGILGNIIPSSTGAAKAIDKIIPDLKDKLTGIAFRVPTANVSVIDLTCELNEATNYHSICNTIQHASNNNLHGILGITEDKVVSTDFYSDTHAAVFDKSTSFMLDSTLLKVIAWYDNEWGYVCQLLRMAEYLNEYNK